MSFVFVSGNLALDLAGTLKWRRSEPEELLEAPADLARWAVEAGVLTEAPALDTADVARVRALREAVYRLALHGMRGLAWPDDDLRLVNEETGGAPARMSLTPAGVVRTGGVEAVAAEVARAAVGLLGGAERSRVRECGRAACTRVFVDRSRAGNRQWCGMEECGNRVKAAAYRARRSKSSPAGAS
ncbi:CGNR zinc finger domain-containing protein [Nonomuraea roseoviolacea]|uniref:RNA-binding Zn ribbon-like protein n=1 Tax=Nonomuraea roseoviolacea subsp. carminata TaxID=160689 RepID=A0ABT1JW55_9ACTN|nr:ABATE domain-containing protein [Nonomuraea roseoviolacea]MCP2345993.1 putative RNA-binding Zn ribbon-like protein [Nonomuraea roseoviolacea subsp. carminata]